MHSGSKSQILEAIYNTVILKDIVARERIRDVSLLERLIQYVFSEVGHVFSASSISKYLKSEGDSVSKDTLLNYLHACENAFLIRSVPFHDVKGKRLLNVNEKYYIIDHGIRESLLGRNVQDIELILENIVYFELLRRGYHVAIGRNGVKEIDFVATKDGKLEYYQVCYLLATEETRAREFRSFDGLKDNFPRFVLSTDRFNFSRDGIAHRNIEDWLME
jgi:predicted AAA+ superfamily ATPase